MFRQTPSTAQTRLACLIGYPARYSLSPRLHEAAYESLGVDARYLVFPVTRGALQDAVNAIRTFNLLGVSVTVPHKQDVVQMLDALSPEAQHLEAVNTIVNRDGVLTGYNTDGAGFLAGLRADGFDPKGSQVAVIGAGGSARAVTTSLVTAGVKNIAIVGRTRSKVDSLVALGGPNCRPGGKEDIARADLVVNCTPVGMDDQPGNPVEPSLLRERQFVADLIYAPTQTELLQAAQSAGAHFANGVSMLVHQAAEQVRLFTGRQPDVEVMRAALSRSPQFGEEQ